MELMLFTMNTHKNGGEKIRALQAFAKRRQAVIKGESHGYEFASDPPGNY